MKRVFTSAVFIAVLTVGFVSFVEGNQQEQEQVFRVSVPAANIRFEPNTKSPIIGRAEIGPALSASAKEHTPALSAPAGLS